MLGTCAVVLAQPELVFKQNRRAVARMERQRNAGMRSGAFPDVACAPSGPPLLADVARIERQRNAGVWNPDVACAPSGLLLCACLQLALPGERVGDYGCEIVELRMPFENRARAIGSGDDLRRISGPPAGELDCKVD